jgi:hypothetical protein
VCVCVCVCVCVVVCVCVRVCVQIRSEGGHNAYIKYRNMRGE